MLPISFVERLESRVSCSILVSGMFVASLSGGAVGWQGL